MSQYASLKAYKSFLKDNNELRTSQSVKRSKNQDDRSSQNGKRISCQSETRKPQQKRVKTQLGFQLHDPEKCVCCQCECGQHKCKIQCNKPDIHKSTTYHDSFKNTMQNLKKQEIVLFTPNKIPQKVIDLKTIYQQKFSSKPINVQKPLKTPDHTKFQGPSLQVTTYQQKFPGYNGKNPYVKTKPQDFRGGLRFRGKSMYNSTFLSLTAQKMKPLKQPASLKTQGNWLGSSSYKQSFNPSNIQKLQSINYKPPKEVYNKRPSSAYHFSKHFKQKLESSYQTLYENPFTNNFIDVNCPAKSLMLKISQRKELHESMSERKKLSINQG